MSKQISDGLAILGGGIFAGEAYLPALKALQDSNPEAPQLKAVYSRSLQTATNFANAASKALQCPTPSIYQGADESANLDTLLDRPDISSVIIVLPITVQPSVITKALSKGKHVLSEKPVASTVKEGKELIQRYESEYKGKGLIWRVAENFEAEEVFLKAAALIKEGKIGKVQTFKTTTVNFLDQSSKYYKTPWRTVPEYQGGFLLDGGVHTIAAIRTMLPDPITHLSGFASLNKDYLAPHDTIHAIVKAGGYHGIVEMSFAHPIRSKPAGEAYLVTGSKGFLSVGSVPPSEGTGMAFRLKVQTEGPGEETKEEAFDFASKGVAVELASFAKSVQNSEKDVGDNLGDPKGCLLDVAFIEAALKSNGSLVDLTQL